MWLVLISTCGLLTFVMSLAFCLCWKKKQSNSSSNGVDGMVVRKNPDENVNHIPPTNITIIDDGNKGRCIDHNRAILQTTRRSLPDIPFEQEIGTWESQIDNSSEHYATVEQYQNSNKRHTLPNGMDVRPSTSQQSSLSQADFSPYEKVNYDKITSQDHPYAQLQLITNRSVTIDSKDVTEESGSSQRDQSIYNGADGTRENTDEHNSDIPAASAVAGGIAASLELPYMTPPVLHTNFSGDSQDSSKGYTSISVREPLVNIMAQTKENIEKHGLDPHYSTVSDDSDDVYTTIPDQNQLYTSESETYARIPQTPIMVEAEINQCLPVTDSSDTENAVCQTDPEPTLPSSDNIKQTGKSHIQAASSSSNLGSPKPEKRQANSPLPLLPTMNSSDGDKRIISPRSIDELYAKVQKTKTRCSSDERSSECQTDGISTDHTSSIIDDNYSQIKTNKHNYEILGKSHDRIEPQDYGYACMEEFGGPTSSDPGYEILKNISSPDPNDEKLGNVPFNTSDSKCSKIEKNELSYGYSVVNKQKNGKTHHGSEVSHNDNHSRDNIIFENDERETPKESFSDCQYTECRSEMHDSHTEPYYEKVEYLGEPCYERVASHSSVSNSEIAEYEQITSRGHGNIYPSRDPEDVKDLKNSNLEE